MTHWQFELADQLKERLPRSSRAGVKGSAQQPTRLDGWSDLDLDLWLDQPVELAVLVDPAVIWAYEAVQGEEQQVVRTVFADGRRLDLQITGPDRLGLPVPDDVNDVRFIAAQAATKLGRGDRLIGLHLSLEIAQLCLVQAMQLRDRDQGTAVHHHGTERDRFADELHSLFEPGQAVGPDLVLALVARYDRLQGELGRAYRPDWSGLSALVDRGRSVVGVERPNSISTAEGDRGSRTVSVASSSDQDSSAPPALG